jgi:hypothetical protein
MSATDYAQVFATDMAANEIETIIAIQPSSASMTFWNGNNLHYTPDK